MRAHLLQLRTAVFMTLVLFVSVFFLTKKFYYIFLCKVREFANGYTLLREMGFSSNSVAEALLMYDNDTDKAVAHFLNGSS